MAEPKTLLVSRGQGKAVPMSVTEYRRLLHNMAPQDRRGITVRGKVDGVVSDLRGNLQQRRMEHEEVAARVDRGEDPVLTGADDPRRDMVRRQDIAKREFDAAQSPEAQAAMLYRVMPFIGQALQNEALGPEEAAEFRQKLLSANRGKQIGIDLATMALMGFGAARAFPTLAQSFRTTKGIKGFRNLMAAGAGADTLFYGQYLADANKKFSAEDYARELAVGALINLPIAGVGAARSAIVGGARAVLGGGLEGLGGLGDLAVTRAVLARPGTATAAKAARTGAAFRVISKFGRKIRGGKKVRPTTVVDPLAEAQQFSKYQQRQIAKLEPTKLAKMDPIERNALIAEVSGWAGIDPGDFKGVKFDVLPDRLRAAEKTIKQLDDHVGGVARKVGRGVKGIGGRATTKQKQALVTELNSVLYRLETNGWKDMATFLDDLLETKVVKLEDGSKVRVLKRNHVQNFGAAVKARLYAELNRNVLGGAAEAADDLARLMKNKDVWGSGKAVEVARKANDAIEDLAKAQKNLRQLANDKVNIKSVEGAQRGRATRINTELKRIREGFRRLEELKLLKEGQADAFRDLVTKSGKSIAEGSEAFAHAGRINTARGKAAGVITDRLGRVEQGMRDFKAQMAGSAGEEATRKLRLNQDAVNILEKGLDAAAVVPVTGVVVLRSMEREEKKQVFEFFQDQLPLLAGNPEAMQARLSDALGGTENADPEVTQLAGVQTARTIMYLNSALPRPSYSMLGGTEAPVTQQEAFLQKVGAVLDPISVAYAALEGRVTPDMIEALRVTQEATYAELSIMLSDALSRADLSKAPRKTINGIQTFLGGLDPLYRGDALRLLQSNFAQNAEQQQAISGPGQPLPNAFNQTSPTDRGNDFTFTQRLTSY